MNPFAALIRIRLESVRNAFANVKRDSVAKTLVVGLGLSNVIALAFWVSYKSFEFIEGFRAFGDLNSKMVALLFLALLVLVVFSTVIITYTTVFVAKETQFLFESPISPRTTLFVKIAEAVSFSAWASLFLGLPVLVAFGVQQEAPGTYYAEISIILPLFLLFAGLVGACLALVLAPVMRRMSPRAMLLCSVALLVALTFVFLRSFDLGRLDGDNHLLVLDRFTSGLRAMHSPYSPSRWASTAVLSAAAGNHREVAFHGLTLLANTLIFLPLLSLYGVRLYQKEWLARQSVAGGRRVRRRQRGTLALLGKWPTTSLIVKDVLVFLRSPAQLSQSMLFVLLLVIYSLSLLQVPDFVTEHDRLRYFLHFANLAAICMIVSSFTSRFLFPLISLEGRAFWILGLAPLPRRRLLDQKMLFGVTISLGLGMVAVVVSNLALQSTTELFLGAAYTMALSAICLASLAAGLGAAYPSFDEDNPARIAVGLGGTMNFFASALTLACLLAIEAAPYLLAMAIPEARSWRGALVIASHGTALLFTLVLCTLVLRLGSRNLARTEF